MRSFLALCLLLTCARYNTWEKKKVVDDRRFHVKWSDGGARMDKYKAMLKLSPMKKSLKTM